MRTLRGVFPSCRDVAEQWPNPVELLSAYSVKLPRLREPVVDGVRSHPPRLTCQDARAPRDGADETCSFSPSAAVVRGYKVASFATDERRKDAGGGRKVRVQTAAVRGEYHTVRAHTIAVRGENIAAHSRGGRAKREGEEGGPHGLARYEVRCLYRLPI